MRAADIKGLPSGNIYQELKISDFRKDKRTCCKCDSADDYPSDSDVISHTAGPQAGHDLTLFFFTAHQTVQYGPSTKEGTLQGHAGCNDNDNLRIPRRTGPSQSEVSY